jgi:hypothetical protein
MYCAFRSLTAKSSIDENTLLASQALKVMVFCFLRIRLNCEKGALKAAIYPTRGNVA